MASPPSPTFKQREEVQREMTISGFPRWEEIELAERYLICCMFEEASDLSSSILQRLHKSCANKYVEDHVLYDMMDSTGMVFVQSLKQLKRTERIFDELAAFYHPVGAIPVHVLLMGACFQISEGCLSGLQSTLEEYIYSWKPSPDKLSYNHVVDKLNGCSAPFPLSIDEYVEVAEAYSVVLLGNVYGNTDHAASWIEAAHIPDARRQELLDKLRALIASKASKPASGLPEHEDNTVFSVANKTSVAWKSLSGPSVHSISLKKTKLGQFMASKARLLFWASLTLFVLNILRKKGSIWKRILAGQVLYVRKVLLDFWRLAFSVQVNPLAAVQPLPRSSGGS